jgi:hypothetical protein
VAAGVVAVSREIRWLARELRPGPRRPRRPLAWRVAGWVLRHLPEILAVLLLVRAWQVVANHISPLWTNLLGCATVAAAVGWSRSRWWLLAVVGCLLTRHRLRTALAELRLGSRAGRLPVLLALLPTPVGERVWLCCPVGVAAEDIAEETERLRSACYAREVRVTRDRRCAALVTVEVVRRDPLAAGRPVRSWLGDTFPGGGRG